VLLLITTIIKRCILLYFNYYHLAKDISPVHVWDWDHFPWSLAHEFCCHIMQLQPNEWTEGEEMDRL
jgi:hypothetical protein